MSKLATHQAAFAMLWATSSLLAWKALADTLALSMHDDAYTHLILILPVCAALLYRNRNLLRVLIDNDYRMGSALLAISLFLGCSTLAWNNSFSSDLQLSVRMLALVLSWIGAFVICFGSRASRSVLFPLGLLFGLVPLPQFMLNALVALLQLASAWAAHLLFAAFGIPVAQDGVVLAVPGLTLHVAQECSSIRSSSMLLTTTMVLAYLLLRSNWRRILLICLVFPLSVAKNGLRIFTIAMLGIHVDRGYLTGRFHHDGGVAFFAIVLIAILVAAWIFRRGETWPLNADLEPMKPQEARG
jgi:exosortase